MAWAPEMFHTGLVNDQVPGDIVECGAWRGGASIFSKGVVDVLDPTGGRKILVADTFVGFPAADKNDGVDQCINQIVEARVVSARLNHDLHAIDASTRFADWFAHRCRH